MGPAEDLLRITLAIGTLGASEVTRTAVNVTKAVAQGAHALAESLAAEPSAEERYARFQQEVMPGAAAGFVDQLELYALVGASEIRPNGADFTLVSEYRPGTPLLVSVRGRITAPVTRASIAALVIKSGVPLPAGCRAIVNSASLRYQTDNFRYDMINDQRVNDDIDLPIVAGTGTPDVPAWPTPPIPGFPLKLTQIPGITPVRSGSGAMLYTPLDEWEQRSPRHEDIRLSARLVEHLNTNLEYYHHAIWWTMDPNRRYMFLDGYQAPNAGGRSVASVVENTLIGIVGNSLILPVAPGNRLDPTFEFAKGVTLLEHYDPQSPAPPSRVSLPTRGVFAEAVMGDCNACEEIDDTRFWRWEESPIDEPPALDMSALASRRAEPNYGTPTPFPSPIVNIQNAPQAPDPAGVQAALDAISRQSFADITGLAGTQANAAAAYAKAMDTALAFGKEASQLAQQASMTKNIGQTMRAIDKAEGENKIDKGDAKQLRTSALKTMTGDTPSDPMAASVADRLKVIADQEASGNITPEGAAQRRAEVMKGLAPDEIRAKESDAATAIVGRMPGGMVESVETETIKVKGRPGSIPGLVSSALLGAAPGSGNPAVVQRAFGIDVSALNGRVDWDKFVNESGHSFAFVKATKGASIIDRRFNENWAALRDAPLIRGAYHFYRFNEDPEAQANLFMATVGDLDQPGDLPPVIDIEWESLQKDSQGDWIKPNVDTLIDEIRFWVQRVEARYGRKPIIYTGPEFWDRFADNSNEFQEYPLWVTTIWQKPPEQVSEPRLFGGWTAWTFWQVGYDKRIPGVRTPTGFDGVDVNLFNGTLESLWPLAQMPRPQE
jgi:GH25 family lysozyme M1 (1,4-beta-N-acetylmuramidase)